MTDESIKLVVGEIKDYIEVANHPSPQNNIIIEGDIIKLIVDGAIIKERKIPVSEMMRKLNEINYPSKNPFNSSDIKYSPLEADKKSNKQYWAKNHYKIDFPKFISVILFSLLTVGSFPDISEFCKIYMRTYMEVIPKDYVSKRKNAYADEHKSVNDRTAIGKKMTCDGTVFFENKNIRFKEKYLVYLKDIDYNEFTTEFICNRIYKMFGSIIRDIHTSVLLFSCGANTKYDFFEDLKGTDFFVNEIPVRAYTQTFFGKEFANKKEFFRHSNVDFSKFIKLEVQKPSGSGLKLMPAQFAKDFVDGLKSRKILKGSTIVY